MITRKRLAVDLPIHLHKEVKEAAMQHNCTITRWVIGVIIERLKMERLYDEERNKKNMPKLL